MAEQVKILWKMDNVTEVKHKKLISIGIHIGKKKYYALGDNDPSLSESASPNLYTLFDASTDNDKVTGPELEPMETSNPLL